ncbi:YfhO family protein [Caproiciproducens faecalis]|uniref:YfhO family protein n=1 Tax=Caproiciproducens faecalis TaxID=2820301 RepID=A0ABS7DR26_9FIRM|nr:YfhO family protein [Caproiciproducens faecalis]MBW7573754.1 YfhO family protein [Caproiciproducens faecalis]
MQMKRTASFLLAPVSVMFIMLSVFFVGRMFPFGYNTLSWCDMNQQVIPFLMDFKDILSGKANMFLNMQNAGGMSFWGVFLFFISSPFSLLVAFVNKADFYLFMNILVLLKMMTCALTASVFFHFRFKHLGMLQNTAISVMYAFCGYTMFYYQNQVWLDVMYLFPILLIGLIKLTEEGNILLYVLSFSAILTVNFYLSYMVSVFLMLSAGVYVCFFAKKGIRRKNILLLGISTLITALITCVVWLPSLMQYVASARTGNLFTSLRVGGLISRLDTTFPVILCSGAIFSALILYLLFASQLRPKIGFPFIIFLLTVIPVFIEPINKMWQTGNYQAFPVRYGYITIFFGLILFAALLSEINQENRLASSNSISVFGGMLAVSAVFLAECLIFYKEYDVVTVYTETLWGNSASFRFILLFSLAAGLAYLVLLLLYKFNLMSRIAFSVLLCVMVVLECVFNSGIYIASSANNGEAQSSVIDLSERIPDDSFYRVKTEEKYFDVNLMGSLGYNTLSHYTSLTGQDFMFTMKKLGYSSYWMEVNSNGGTKLTDAIMGNRYTILRKGTAISGEKQIYQNEKYEIRETDDTLPVGFVIHADQIGAFKTLPDTTRLKTQQFLFESLFHTKDKLFTYYEPTVFNNIAYSSDNKYSLTYPDNSAEGSIVYRIPVEGTETLYFDCFDRLSNSLIEHINSSFNILVNGLTVQDDYPNQSNNGILNLGTYRNQTVEVEIQVLKEVNAKSFGIAGLQDDVLKKAVGTTATAQLKQSGNKIIGTADAADDRSYLFLPVTDDKGYTATVNGNQANIYSVLDSMMAIKLNKGKNEISVSYIPPGFQLGISLSVLGIVIFILFLILLKRGFYQKIQFLEIPATVLFALLCIGVFAAVYIFPLIIFYWR